MSLLCLPSIFERIREIKTVLVAAAFFSTALGCAGPLKQMSYNSAELSRLPSFTRAELSSHPVAILPGTGEKFKESVGISLANALKDFSPDLTVVPPDRTVSLLNRAGLGRTYSNMARDFRDNGILEKEALRQISGVLEVRYVLLPILVDYRQEESTRISVFGVRFVRTRTSTLQIMLQIWNGETGELAWQGSAEITLAGEDVREKPIRFDEISLTAWTHLIESFPAAEETSAAP